MRPANDGCLVDARANRQRRFSEMIVPVILPLLFPIRSCHSQTSVAQSPAAADAKLDAAGRQRLIDAVIADLEAHCFDKDVAQKAVEALVAHEKSGDDNTATDGEAFADLLTRQLRDASHDMHLEVVYSRDKLPGPPPQQTPESLARFQKAMEQENCMFRKVEILPHNIGYLKLDFFPEPSICRSTAIAAMTTLNHASAIV
jgi:hypothetical protein